ncbi:MAG: zinc ribbon domain-containing protein [Acidihalobacter sp.]|uniref:FmdB family zinc ribbon protein n=1 Tax=Acidihalobacter sp. TaxID=1872108 RepID=UPI00307D86C0
MPLYEYACTSCGTFSQFAPLTRSAEPADCPECGESAPKVIGAPALALMPASLRAAHASSEKSAHEPRRAKRGCGCHGGAHTCGTGSSGAAKPALKAPSSAATRPWMLGH